MSRLIFAIVSLIVLTIVVVMNAGYDTGFNLFGFKLESIPTIAIVLVSFVAGILYSFLIYVVNYFFKSNKRRIKSRGLEITSREKALKEKEQSLDDRIDVQAAAEINQAAAMTEAMTETAGEPVKKKSAKSKKK